MTAVHDEKEPKLDPMRDRPVATRKFSSKMYEPVIYVMSFPGGNDAVKRHYPFWKRAGLEIIGVGTEGGGCVWPNGLPQVSIGKNTYVDGDHHPKRFIGVLEHFMTIDRPAAIVIEYDSICLQPFPPFENKFYGTIAGHKSEGFKADNYYHTPWIVNQAFAEIIIHGGKAMLKAGLNEHGFIDRWLGLLVELYDLPVVNAAGFSYCRNSIDRPEYVQEAREAIRRGVSYIHGLKTEAQLKAVTEGLV